MGPGHDGPPEDTVIRRRDGTFEQVKIPIAGCQSESKFDRNTDPGYMSRKIRKFRTDKFDTCNKRKF